MELAKQIAVKLGVEEQDGWYYVGDIVDIDGSPWVEEKVFLEIVEMLGHWA